MDNLPYSYEQFEKDVQRMKPRFFDTYILPPFLMWYAYKSKEMRKNTRRILFSAGTYMLMRNYINYKEGVKTLYSKLQSVNSPSPVGEGEGGEV